MPTHDQGVPSLLDIKRGVTPFTDTTPFDDADAEKRAEETRRVFQFQQEQQDPSVENDWQYKEAYSQKFSFGDASQGQSSDQKRVKEEADSGNTVENLNPTTGQKIGQPEQLQEDPQPILPDTKAAIQYAIEEGRMKPSENEYANIGLVDRQKFADNIQQRVRANLGMIAEEAGRQGEVRQATAERTGFVPGTTGEDEQLPVFEDETLPTPKQITRRTDNWPAFVPREFKRPVSLVKIGGESMAVGAADVADLIADVMSYPADKLAEALDYPVIEIDGKQYRDIYGIPLGPSTFSEMMEDAIVTSYSAIGVEPTLEEVDGFWDNMFRVAGNFAGGSLGFRAGLAATEFLTQAAKSSSKLPAQFAPGVADRAESIIKSMTQNYKDVELRLGAAGVSGAGLSVIGFGEETDTPEQTRRLADVGQLAGIFAPMGLSAIGLTTQGIVKGMQFKRALSDDQIEKMAAEQGIQNFSRELRRMVAFGDIPKMMEDIKLVGRIRKEFPEFSPNIAHTINTQEAISKAVQVNKIDYKEAERIHRNNMDVLNTMRDRLASDPSKDKTSQILDILRLRKREVANYTAQLQKHADDIMGKIQGTAQPDVDPVTSQQELVKNLGDIRKEFIDIGSRKYDAVDPEHKVKLSPRDVSTLVRKTMSEFADEYAATSATHDAFNYLENTFPKVVNKQIGQDYVNYLSREQSRMAEELKPKTVSQLLGFKPQQVPEVEAEPIKDYLSFKDVHNLIVTLKGEARALSRGQGPNSRGHEKLYDLAQSLEDTSTNAARLSGDDGISARYQDALSFWRDEVAARFMDRNTIGFDYTVAPRHPLAKDFDKIGPEVFRKGAKVSKLDQYAKTVEGSEIEDVAWENLSQYALSTLDTAMAGSKDPMQTITKFSKEYGPAIERIPNLGSRILDMKTEVLENLDDYNRAVAQQQLVKESILTKYIDTDASIWADKILFNADFSAEQARSVADDVFASAAASTNVGPRELLRNGEFVEPNRFGTTVTGRTFEEIQGAIDDTLTYRILNHFTRGDRSLDTKAMLKYVNGEAVNQKLSELLSPRALADLEVMSKAQLLDDARLLTDPGRSFNPIRQWFKDRDFDPASATSRYLQMQIGKVGKVFLVVDRATKSLYSMTDKTLAPLVQKNMHDWETLENLVRRLDGDSEFLRESRELRTTYSSLWQSVKGVPDKILKKLSKSGTAKIFQGSLTTDRIVEEGKLALPDQDFNRAVDFLYPDARVDGMSLDEIYFPEELELPREDKPEETLIQDTSASDASQLRLDPRATPEMEQAQQTIGASARAIQDFADSQTQLAQEPVTGRVVIGPTGVPTWQ